MAPAGDGTGARAIANCLDATQACSTPCAQHASNLLHGMRVMRVCVFSTDEQPRSDAKAGLDGEAELLKPTGASAAAVVADDEVCGLCVTCHRDWSPEMKGISISYGES